MRGSRLAALLVACGLLAGLGGCGDDDSASSQPSVRIALDFTPNAVHAPIFTAARVGADRAHGVRLSIVRPGSRPDTVKTLLTRRADVGVLDIHDLALARAEGRPLVAVGALVQRPLGALIAQPEIRRPRDLDGKTVGVSGLPSDPPFLEAIVSHDGGDYESIKQVTIGFTGASALLSRRVAAVPAFWNVEGVVLRRRGRKVKEFRIDDYGAPPFPEVVIVTTEETLRERREDVLATLAAIGDGAKSVLSDPAPAVAQIARESGGDDRALVRDQFAALRPIVDPSLKLNRPVLEQWAAFVVRVGILEKRPDVARAFVTDLR